MAEPICEDEGLLQEWSPLTQLLQNIPLKIQKGLFSQNLNLTCLDVISDYITLGTNSNLVYWYSRVNGDLQRLRLENSNSDITCVKVVSTVDYMVAAGTSQGTVTVFQIPKEVPESLPTQLKPKKKQIERFTISGLHNGPITNIEWSQNGMKLFSGDKNGVVVLTEIDFAMHLTKSAELLNEHFEITQLSYCQQCLLISTVFRSIICDGTRNWKAHQVGTKERKILGKFGATFCKFDHGTVLYACRPGYRLWLSNKVGVVQQTLIFKSALQSTCPKIQVINPVNKKEPYDTSFGKVIQFGDNKLITYNSEVLYVLHPGAVSVVSVLCNARKILDLAVNENEIFVLEGERSLLRISHAPDKYSIEMLYHPVSRKTTFNLDNFAAKIKDTAVGSIKKITKDFITLPEETSPDSPPTLADEALELPPIIHLPDGTMPSLFPENVEIHSSVQNSGENGLGQASKTSENYKFTNEFEDKISNQYCHEEVISRPLRKKRTKKPKNALNSLDLKSDTSSTSDDRMTWGVANDLSLSEESGMSESQSSFSVLRDISGLMNQSTVTSNGRDVEIEDIIAISDNKSQTSLDTCESVSEHLLTSDKFRVEQEKIFSRLANKPLIVTGSNSEKTDNMSVSLNMTTSSSVSSKISENIMSASDYSENSSMVLGTKTTESQISDNFENQDQCTPNVNCYSYHSNFEENNLSSQEDMKTNSTKSLPSSGNSQTEHQYPPSNWLKNEKSVDHFAFNDKAFSKDEKEPTEVFNSQVEEMTVNPNNITQSFLFENDASKIINSKIDFTINNLSDFYSQEHLEKIESSEELSDQFFNSNTNANDEGDLKVIEKGNKDFENLNCSAQEPLSYGPPSGSSLLGSQPLSDFPSTSQANAKNQIFDFSDHWPQHKTPETIVSLAVTNNYALCADINDNVYYADLSGVALCWVLLDYKASAIKVSNDGSMVLMLNKKKLLSLVDPTNKGPISTAVEEIASNVLSFSVDCKKSEGWIVTVGGEILHYYYSIETNCPKLEEVPCDYFVVDITSSEGKIVVLTENQKLLYKLPSDNSFKIVKTHTPSINSMSFGPDDLLWVVNDNNLIYFSVDYTNEEPHWWQVQISEFVFQNSSVTFQNIYSKIKLNNLKVSAQSKVTHITSNQNSVWIYDKFTSTTHVNKSNFTGYNWCSVLLKNPVFNVCQWQALCAEGVFEDKGHVWLLSTDGDIFCLSPNSNHFQAISVPCDDYVICLASSTDTLWVLSESGRVYSRLGLTEGNLLGNSWRELKLPQIDNLKLVWVSCGCDVAWGCDILGRTFITIGSPHHMATNIFDAAWLEVEGKPKNVQFEKVFVGPQLYMVWAIDVKGNLYVREGIFSHYQIGTSWVYVGGIEAVHLSISGTSVWALTTNGRIYRRCGISDKNYIGDFWKSIPGTFKMMTSSFTNDLWGVTQNNEIMRLSYYVKLLDEKNLYKKEFHTSKEDISWELVE